MLSTMAATVLIVGNRRENPSVYLRPIAQAISHRPATSRKSQAMEDPPQNVFSSQFFSTPSAVRAARPAVGLGAIGPLRARGQGPPLFDLVRQHRLRPFW